MVTVMFSLWFCGGDMNYLKNNPIVFAAIIVAIGIIIAAFVYQYYSPYQGSGPINLLVRRNNCHHPTPMSWPWV